MTNACCEEDTSSLEEELITRSSNNSPLFKMNNANVYYRLEESTRSTVHSSSVKPSQRKKDGRNSCFSVIKHHAGVDQ